MDVIVLSLAAGAREVPRPSRRQLRHGAIRPASDPFSPLLRPIRRTDISFATTRLPRSPSEPTISSRRLASCIAASSPQATNTQARTRSSISSSLAGSFPSPLMTPNINRCERSDLGLGYGTARSLGRSALWHRKPTLKCPLCPSDAPQTYLLQIVEILNLPMKSRGPDLPIVCHDTDSRADRVLKSPRPQGEPAVAFTPSETLKSAGGFGATFRDHVQPHGIGGRDYYRSVNDRFGLDLDLVVADQARHLDQRVRRPDVAEIAAVDARRPASHWRLVAHIDARAHDVLERAAERLDARCDLVEDVDGLAAGIAAGRRPRRCRGSRWCR